ncbi:MAG: hypothetical protein NTX82_03645 [Candidatus Parcubacteria bacterium]|nr:hypothetical protein [Candidatus Parcubacteria bacterium]
MLPDLDLTKADPKKPTITEMREVRVHDGKGGSAIVQVGDKVDLLDPVNNTSGLEYLGPGPYTIEWLARWRCGAEFLQLTTPTKGEGKGINACEMKIAS